MEVESGTQRDMNGGDDSQSQSQTQQEMGVLVVDFVIIRYLYVAHFFARWDARMWEFSVGLYMISLCPNSLILPALYGAVESASTAVFGPLIGRWVQTSPYLKVLRAWLVAQNLSFIVAGCSVFALLFSPNLKSHNLVAFVFLVLLTNISGAVGALSALAGTILIEREWVVVACEGHPPRVLTEMNSVIRRIDLFCKLVAPVITGLIISFKSVKSSALALAVWNSSAVWIEFWLFTSVYKGIPALGVSDQRRTRSHSRRADQGEGEAAVADSTGTGVGPDNPEDVPDQRKGWKMRLSERVSRATLGGVWRVYFGQDILLAGLALALLYFTVLSFGTLMTATLQWEGIPAFVIGIARGMSAGIGVCATVVYPILHSRLSTVRTGLWSIWSQWTCLLVSVASIWVHRRRFSAYMLMTGVAASRLGLWMFDLAVTQLMQDQVPELDRCVVGGVQNSLQSYLDLLAYVMGIIVSKPGDFWVLTLLSFSAASLAAVLYSLFSVK